MLNRFVNTGTRGSRPFNRYALELWLRSPRGRQVQALEERELRKVLPDLFGRYVLQVGSWGRGDRLLQSSEMPHRAVLGTAPDFGAQALAEPERLPVPNQSVDAVVLPHTLEFSRAPHPVLREASRILTDRGRLFILGFDPWSPWAWRQAIGLRYRAFPPGARFVGRGRLCDWLELLDFEVTEIRDYGVRWFDRWFGAGPRGYLVVAKKRVIPLNLVGRVARVPLKPVVRPLPVAGAHSTGLPPGAVARTRDA